MVEVTLQLPDDVAQQVAGVPGDISRRILETIASEYYRAGKLSRQQVGQLLHLNGRQTDTFLENRAVAAPSAAEGEIAPTDRDLEAFRRALPSLLHTDRGRFVAISKGQVVDRDPDEFALVERISRERPGQGVLIQRVAEELDEVHIETPELEFIAEPKR